MSDSQPTSKELLPCPFCGYAVDETDVSGYGELDGRDADCVCCPECENMGPMAFGKDGAVVAWNKRHAHEPPAVLESNARLAEFLRCKADGAGHEDAALLGLCARAIEKSSRPPPGPVSVTVPQRDLDKLIVAVHAVLDAYEGRFEIEASGGRYWGPIDDEIKALRSALTKCAESPCDRSGG
jgi:Lar family restriction alleviation protein